MATRDVFSAEELAQLREFPEINRTELICHFTLSGADVAFLREFRTGRNVGCLPAVKDLLVDGVGFGGGSFKGVAIGRGEPEVAAVSGVGEESTQRGGEAADVTGRYQ